MNKTVFAERLRHAAERTRDFTRTLIIEPLPDAIRFDVRLNESYDGNPLHPDERVYPDDPKRIPEHHRSRLSEAQVVELLWREGTVPEWIDLSVEQEDGEYTLIEMLCCGRFTANEQLLYHEKEGHPPFHVLGPSIPPSYNPESRERYSLNWFKKPRDRQELARLRDRAEHIESLHLSGPGFDDDVLEELALTPLHRLATLHLEGTRIRGPGLRHLVHGVPLSTLSWKADHDLPMALQAIEPFRLLKYLHLEGRASLLEGLSTLGSLPHLEMLTLRVPDLSDIGFLRTLDSLEWLELAGSRVRSLDVLTQLRGLKHLSIERTAVEDEDLRTLAGLTRLRLLVLDETSIGDEGLVHLRKLPKLWRLFLKGTRVGDPGLKHLSRLNLKTVDLRDTQVTEQGVAWLQRKRPELHIRSAFQRTPLRPHRKTGLEEYARRLRALLKRE